MHREATELAADLFRLGRFDLFRRCEALVNDWATLLLRLLLSADWGPDMMEALRRHGSRVPGNLAGGWWKPEKVSQRLPADWPNLARVSPDLVHTAVLIFAGLTGDVTLVRELIDRTDLTFLPPSELASLLPHFQLAVAALPEIEAKVVGIELQWFLTADNGPVTRHYLGRITSCQLASPIAAAAEVVLVAAKVQPPSHLLDYLNEVSFAPTLDLGSLQTIVQEYVRRALVLGAEDRWLWRASLRQLLPVNLRQLAERMLCCILAGRRDLLEPAQLRYEQVLLG